MIDGVCDWYTQGIKLPEFTSLPDMFKKMQIANCEEVCPEHDCSFAEQDRAFNQFTMSQKNYFSDFES